MITNNLCFRHSLELNSNRDCKKKMPKDQFIIEETYLIKPNYRHGFMKHPYFVNTNTIIIKLTIGVFHHTIKKIILL